MGQVFQMVMEYGPEAAQAALAVVGGLKVFARYTKWEWDDKALAACEKPIKMILSWFPKKKK